MGVSAGQIQILKTDAESMCCWQARSFFFKLLQKASYSGSLCRKDSSGGTVNMKIIFS